MSHPPHHRPTRRLRDWSRTSILTGALAVLSAVLIVSTPSFGESIRPADPLITLLLAALFGLTAVTVFHIEFRREALSFSVSEVPLVLALVYVAPGLGLLARLAGSLIAFALFKRPPLNKLLFNLAVFSVETAVAYQVSRAVIDVGEDSNIAVVAATGAAAVIAGILGSIAVSVVIANHEGGTIAQIAEEFRSSLILVVNSAAAAVMLSLSFVSPVLAALTALPICAMWFILRRHGQIAQRLRDLSDVYSFAGRVGRSLDLDEICEAAVSETRRLMRADSVSLLLFQADGDDLLYDSGDGQTRHDGVAELTAEVRAGLDSPDEVLDEIIDGSGTRALGLDDFRTIVAPVEDEEGSIGMLVAAGRSGAARRFEHSDVGRVQNLVEQLASIVRKGMLHRRIEHEARHDGLTGLPNRNAFERFLGDVASRGGPAAEVQVMMLDLDRFKEVNDTLGHSAGDQLLIEFSRRVSEHVPDGAMFARLAGDEFAILAPDMDRDEALALAEACVDAAGRPVTLNGMSIVVTASVGIATLEPGEDESGAPMRRADIAMYNAKSTHTGIEQYRPELDRRAPARLSMLGDLRAAIEHDELGVDYQPKLDLATGVVIGAEALVRWRHTVRGVVPPTDFIRVAEDTGLIKQLTDLMLSRGIAALRRFHDGGHHLGLSVNLSTHDLLDRELPNRVASYLRRHEVDPSVLTLEITESSLLIDAPRTRVTIDELHRIGVRLSIDDFGTGYSSLSYLRQLPVRELKIDQSFVANVLIDEQDEVIVKSTIDLGHNLGLEVVAEGVENNEVLDKLRRIGCDVAQGYSISRPLPADRFIAWLNTTEHPSRRRDPLLIADLDAPASVEIPSET